MEPWLGDGALVVVWLEDGEGPQLIARLGWEPDGKFTVETTVQDGADIIFIEKLLRHLVEDCDHLKHKRRVKQLVIEAIEKQRKAKEDVHGVEPDIPFGSVS